MALRRVSPQEPSLARGPRLQTIPPSGEQLKVWYFCSLVQRTSLFSTQRLEGPGLSAFL